MKIVGIVLVLLVALLHLGFLVLEMFYWDHEIGRKIFSMTVQQSKDSMVLAMNQGLYNGFLSAGLIWGLFSKKIDVIYFFLGCVVVAGIFGAFTAKPTIFFTQSVPAILAFVAVYLSRDGYLKR
ncbi:DUF1304 domain-containing protein [Arenicella sp. 4NH20-0111]|uniref:DUF1304 domain-containing protein n=1 Tax=Arenicella sp. 4NH20-0111 TaxID=3127648 RepID=UPI00310A96C4